MLSLRLKTGESLDIGDNVTVHVYRWRGDSIELAIDAPREVAINWRKRSDKEQTQQPQK